MHGDMAAWWLGCMVAWRLGGRLPVVAALAMSWPERAFADPPPAAQRANVYSAYEQATIRQVLSFLHATRDENPE